MRSHKTVHAQDAKPRLCLRRGAMRGAAGIRTQDGAGSKSSNTLGGITLARTSRACWSSSTAKGTLPQTSSNSNPGRIQANSSHIRTVQEWCPKTYAAHGLRSKSPMSETAPPSMFRPGGGGCPRESIEALTGTLFTQERICLQPVSVAICRASSKFSSA